MILKANAKINLTLDIKGKREDGYHILDSVFQSVSLSDTVKINKSDSLSVKFSNCDVGGESSIAFKAAKLFFEHTGITGGAEIEIESNIPLSSGMGGGSADSAAVLVGLDKIFNTNLSEITLNSLALKIGADVPFCISGGTARVQGIGEKLEKLPFAGEKQILIIKHGQKLSTADMYRRIDKSPLFTNKTEIAVNSLLNGNKDILFENISNAFGNVFDYSYEKDLLKSVNAEYIGLSGSGPSVFGIFDSEIARNKAYEKIKAMGIEIYRAEFKPSGIEIIE